MNERHVWKLDRDVWVEMTITGKLDSKRLEKLKRFIALLDAEEDTPAPPESEAKP